MKIKRDFSTEKTSLLLFHFTLLPFFAFVLGCGNNGLGDYSSEKDRAESIVATEALAESFQEAFAAGFTAEEFDALLTQHVAEHPVIFGAAIAFVEPDSSGGSVSSCPYVDREEGKLKWVDLNTPEYDVPSQEWFYAPLRSRQAMWSEYEVYEKYPMYTYSIPIVIDDEVVAVVTSDLLANGN
ncbi:MAG: cache domain-containing protein [Verrucomicrobiota bacterium]